MKKEERKKKKHNKGKQREGTPQVSLFDTIPQRQITGAKKLSN